MAPRHWRYTLPNDLAYKHQYKFKPPSGPNDFDHISLIISLIIVILIIQGLALYIISTCRDEYNSRERRLYYDEALMWTGSEQSLDAAGNMPLYEPWNGYVFMYHPDHLDEALDEENFPPRYSEAIGEGRM